MDLVRPMRRSALMCSVGMLSRRLRLSAKRTELLVDADAHGIDEIQKAIHTLEKSKGRPVVTTLFAPPERQKNKKWKQFMEEHGVKFQAVARGDDVSKEPNDRAMERALGQVSKFSKVKCMVLLASDTDFLQTLIGLKTAGKDIIAMVNFRRLSVIRKFEEAGLQVERLCTEQKVSSCKVRATLHANGLGSVQTVADAWENIEDDPRVKIVKTFLAEQGHGEGTLIQKCVKFWITNCSGSLAVFPQRLATIAVHDVMQAAQPKSWKETNNNLAYILPVGSLGKPSKNQLKCFGSKRALAVFRGGGPFVLVDSPDLLQSTLAKLGYLDDALNGDFNEAMFCFLNTPSNKHTLRKLGMLPNVKHRPREVEERLRAALCSNHCSGQWQVATQARQELLKHLTQAQLLRTTSSVDCDAGELFEAMKVYAKAHGIPRMKTFNGLACRILHHNSQNPDRRGLIEMEL